jgi:nucleoside-diphosphate-sugar epimerase
MDANIIWICNTYGPGSCVRRPDDGRMIPNFIRQGLHEGLITIYGDDN